MIAACGHNFDVFNALDVQDNATVLKDLKFGIGDGKLQYYVYNWRCPPIAANEVGLILL
jgi:glycylpeptide N-tetradecanoyltransferase